MLRLSCDPDDLATITTEIILDAVRERRKIIREHRDAKGDHRCWVDDYAIWAALDDSPFVSAKSIKELGMTQCEFFYKYRRSEIADPVPSDAILDSSQWDDDLYTMSRVELVNELIKTQVAIQTHRNAQYNRPSTIDDDRRLYAMLPEKIPADFRLPAKEKFLGRELAPNAGCPAFWESHGKCGEECTIREWGPCKQSTP